MATFGRLQSRKSFSSIRLDKKKRLVQRLFSLWKRTRSGDLRGLQNRLWQKALTGLLGGFDSHAFPQDPVEFHLSVMGDQVLIGAIPMEDMDLVIIPGKCVSWT